MLFRSVACYHRPGCTYWETVPVQDGRLTITGNSHTVGGGTCHAIGFVKFRTAAPACVAKGGRVLGVTSTGAALPEPGPAYDYRGEWDSVCLDDPGCETCANWGDDCGTTTGEPYCGTAAGGVAIWWVEPVLRRDTPCLCPGAPNYPVACVWSSCDDGCSRTKLVEEAFGGPCPAAPPCAHDSGDTCLNPNACNLPYDENDDQIVDIRDLLGVLSYYNVACDSAMPEAGRRLMDLEEPSVSSLVGAYTAEQLAEQLMASRQLVAHLQELH